MEERFYLAQNVLDSIILKKKIYENRYEFDYYSRYKSIEKNLILNINDFTLLNDSINTDSLMNVFPFSFKENEYILTKFNYLSDTLLLEEYFDRNGKQISSINKIYGNGRILNEKQFLTDGTVVSKINYSYDTRNRLVHKITFMENGYTETHYSYSMDEKTETENSSSCIYRYDVHGKIISKKIYSGVKQIAETTYGYNINGDMVAETEINVNGEVEKNRYEYVYDNKNNWKVCVEYNFSGNIFVRTRNITYY
jgi:hypothetical protein